MENFKMFVLKITHVIILITQLNLKIFDFDILIDEKSHENLIYILSYKTVIGIKPLRTRFNKIDGFSRVYNGTKYLVLGHSYLILCSA